MNILFVCEIDYLKKVVFELSELPELLSMRGHNVYVIDYESLWKKKNWHDFGKLKDTVIEKVVRTYSDSLVQLIRPPFIKIPILSRLSYWFTCHFTIERVIKGKKIDAIVLYSAPTNGFQTLILAQKYHIPVIFRSIDILHRLVRNRTLSNITYSFEKLVYRNADLILTTNEKLSEYVIRNGADKGRVRELLAGVDTERFKSIEPNQETDYLRAKLRLKKTDKVILFVGTLEEFSGVDLLIEWFTLIQKEIPEAKLVVVGDGRQRKHLMHMAYLYGTLESIIFTGYQPYDTIPNYINLADICVCPFRINDTTHQIFPVKIIQYLACGKPLICTKLEGVMTVIKGTEQGVVYVDEVMDMIDVIIRLFRSDEERQKLGNNAVNYIKSIHTYDKMVDELEIWLRK